MAWQTNPQGLMRRSRRAFGEWLSIPGWDWYATQTFKADFVSPGEADRHWYSWFNSLRMAAKAKELTPSLYGEQAPFYFRVTEYQDRGTLHFHSLIGGVGDIRRLLFKDFWELHGYARVEAYDRSRGAAGYVAKYLNKADGDIRFSHNLTRHLTSRNDICNDVRG
ncbi:unnamed protein product [marine sediment metagenome]|uniref:Replication-associated protein ORF2/G2P domain-containing protein n=1 Tax=marine sediment metagenome TaxID=412755 RepID=X1SFS8_9ZZZZ